MAQFSFLPALETGELADDLRDLFDELATSLAHTQRAYSGECRPSLDVLETDEAIAEARLMMMGLGGVAVLVAVVVGILINRGVAGPIRLVSRAAERLADGDLTIDELRVASKDEVGLAGQLLIPSPAGDAVRAEQLDQAQLGILVALPAN